MMRVTEEFGCWVFCILHFASCILVSISSCVEKKERVGKDKPGEGAAIGRIAKQCGKN